MFWKTVVLALFVVGVLAQHEITEENKESFKARLREHCKQVGAEDKVDEVIAATQTFIECAKEIVNVENIKKEIEDAKPKGALDEVFKKYCEKSPQIKSCIHSLFDGVTPCLDQSSKDALTSSKNGTDQLIDFVCYKDGDRIALFISEKGPECFAAKVNQIRACADKLKDSVGTVAAANALTMPERCQKFDDLADCIVKAVEECDTPTPGNMAESMFKYVRKSSPCNSALPKN